MKKTDRKNKTNLVVTWPSNIFTIKELNSQNPDFVEITLRVRLKKAIETGEVTEVGVLPNGKGRPTLVLSYGPVTPEKTMEAKNRGVLLTKPVVVPMVNISDNRSPETTTTINIDCSSRNNTIKV